MRVLVACEYSGVVREAFRARGHDAYSCDILPAEDDSPYHIQEDVLELITLDELYGSPWDMMIAHPPCTYLCNAGVHLLCAHKGECDTLGVDHVGTYCAECKKRENRWKHLDTARAFFMTLLDQPIPKICIENPVPHKYGMLPKYTQTIQPYQFGEDASKRTCLWLKGLSPLKIPTRELWVQPTHGQGDKKVYANQTPSGQNKLGPGPNRSLERARTYEKIANAMAEQWG